MRYLARIFKYKGSYSAMIPDVPGCIAAGRSVEEVQKLITEALELHFDLMRQSGEEIPLPTSQWNVKEEEVEEGEFFTWVKVDGRKLNRKIAKARR